MDTPSALGSSGDMRHPVPLPLDCVTVQGASSKSWKAPPMDGSMFLPEMIDWHMENSPSHPFAILAGDTVNDRTTITWSEVGQKIHIQATRFRTALSDHISEAPSRPAKVGIFVNIDSLTYATTFLALLRAGFEPFALSTRNSVPALKHLLESTGTSILIGSLPGDSGQGTALEHTTKAILDELRNITVLSPPRYSDLYLQLKAPEDFVKVPPVRSLPSYQDADDSWPCFILHSSGSTTYPKPISISHRSVQSVLAAPWRCDRDLCGSHWAAMGLPMFHAMGLLFNVVQPMTSGLIPIVFRPSEPPKIPTPDNVLSTMKMIRCDFALAVPSVCEEWAQSDETIKQLATLKGLSYGGGPLSQAAGDRLVTHGVHLSSAYGLTETGATATLLKSLGGHDWAYMTLTHGMTTRLAPEGPGLYRLIVLDSDVHPISVFNVDGERAYDTNDLLQAHPCQAGWYRIIGRADDQIMMSNGEKTNPGPMEDIIASHPRVSTAVMFGRGKAQVGVAIEPTADVRISSEAEIEDFRNTVWPSVEKANAFAPAHSRIFKELTLIVDPIKRAFPRTPKGTVMRNAVLKNLAQEIEALYDTADRRPAAEWAKPPASWTVGNIRKYISQVVHGIIRERHGADTKLDSDVSLFEQGCDSLQATYIRNALLRALRQAPQFSGSQALLAHKVPSNVVFTHYTIERLTEFVSSLLNGDVSTATAQYEAGKRTTAMLEMVSQYSKALRASSGQSGNAQVQQAAAILLTGSTGSLGTYLLRDLLEDPCIGRVYALNRGSSSATLLERQEQAFKARGVDAGLLKSKKLFLVETDISRSDLGLTAALLDEMKACLTGIIHNAWRLDFNLPLTSFESHVQGTLNLVNLALASTTGSYPRVVFTSSVGVVANWSQLNVTVPEAALPDPDVAIGFGYGESKWVAERIIHMAAELYGLDATIWRIGQLAGSTINGAWSTTDWVPIIVKGGQALGALPSYDERIVTWLPVDAAARTVLDSVAALDKGTAYLHLVHPYPQQWTLVFETIGRKLDLPLVPYSEWFAMLEKQASEDPKAVERNPAIKLLDFLRPREDLPDGDSIEALGTPRFATDRAEKISSTLATLPVLTVEDVAKWVEYWTENGLFE